MIFQYLVSYFHTYLVHVGAWTTFMMVMRLKDNPVKPGEIPELLKDSLVAALVLSLLSSFSHNHYKHFLK